MTRRSDKQKCHNTITTANLLKSEKIHQNRVGNCSTVNVTMVHAIPNLDIGKKHAGDATYAL